MTTKALDEIREQSENGSAEPQAPIYCVVPPELSELWEPLSRHFSGDSTVEVVMERRRGERRRGKDRRRRGGRAAAGVERRLARDLEGRRFGERRAVALPVEEQPALPTDLYGYADQLSFVRRLEGALLPFDVARLKETAAAWRERCRAAEQEVTGLLQALVGVADDLGRVRPWSPRRFMAVHRAQRTIERHRQIHSTGSHAAAPNGAPPRDAGAAEARPPSRKPE